MYNGGQAAQPSILHMDRNGTGIRHIDRTAESLHYCREIQGNRAFQAHAPSCNRGISACVVTVVTVVTVNCMVRAASSAAIDSAYGRERHRHPASRRNCCIARKYKGFRRTLCHAADEVPACVVTVVTVVSVNCTPIGASANIAGIGILRKAGYEVKTTDFTRIGIPFTLAAVIPAYIYFWLLYAS